MPADAPSPEQHVPALANTSPVWRRAWHPVAHAEDTAGDAPTQVLVGGDADGRCDLIPSLGRDGNISKRARLRPAYGVTEAYGLVWVAPDEPLAPLPEFPEWDAPGMTSTRSRYRIVGSADDAEDTPQEAFLAAWQRMVSSPVQPLR
jgi:phenylpropionate dioxygenase-like ring-hydroxylating dioxygenase large terminal subunit